MPALGLVILALAVFAALNVELLEAWGAGLAGRFHGGLSLPLTILVVFLAGVLTSLTPCVYPVIPLAITYLGARSATSRLKAFSLAAAYVAGMVVCYTILGAAAGLTGTTFGAATQKWWVYAGVATVVAVFGLSMLGLFNISLPSGLQRLAGRSKGPGYRGAFLMGATSGLVTAPCTAPVLGTLIIPMISNRSVALGSMLLAVFGLGMGMLFLVVGTYSGVLSSLPRSGTWMNAVKYALGAAILLVAVFFFYKAWVMFPLRASGPPAARGQVAADPVAAAGLGGVRSGPAAAPRLVLASALAPFGAGSGPSDARRPPSRSRTSRDATTTSRGTGARPCTWPSSPSGARPAWSRCEGSRWPTPGCARGVMPCSPSASRTAKITRPCARSRPREPWGSPWHGMGTAPWPALSASPRSRPT